MLQLQANAADDQALGEQLNEAASRVNAVGRAYERLAYNADYENIDLIAYLREIVGDLGPTVAPCEIKLDAPEAIQFAGKIRAFTTAGLLLVSMQICRGEQRQETFKFQWGVWGPKAEQEIAILPKAGRAALQKALIACSLFSDDYLSVQYQTECQRASKFFIVEFSTNDSFVKMLLQTAVTLASAADASST
jgi:Histidine kinase